MNTFEKIYRIVKLIPKGSVMSYGDVARLAGNKRLSRVVGYALHVNPDNNNIPCHRVVTKDGQCSCSFAFGGQNAQIQLLKNEGVTFIDNKVNMTKHAYNVNTDKIDASVIKNGLSCDADVFAYELVDSTNNMARTLVQDKAKRTAIIAADAQTEGKGRGEKKFYSPFGKSVYVSIVFKKESLPVKLNWLTCAAAVATCNAVEQALNIKTGIKWVNDLYLNNKKVCGILCEAVGEYVIAGIGVNVYHQQFTDELKDTATTLLNENQGEQVGLKNRLIVSIVNNLMSTNEQTLLNEYRQSQITLNRTVRVNDEYDAYAIDIDDDFNLVVKRQDGGTERLGCGEVSLKLI